MEDKVEKVMSEFTEKLKSSSINDRKQALAIALAEKRKRN